jgi:CPA2 family monovalent cation:H+ antiporter-2
MTNVYPAPEMAAVALGVWPILLDVLVLLTMAMLLGNLAERLGQSVIVGYLIAGTLVGPNALGWISLHAEILNVAEIGVALLLFTIGLEFSVDRLRALAIPALRIGPLQVVLTTSLACLGAVYTGMGGREALIVGMMVAMSSTACVLRLLSDRAEVETSHGRSALGILLFQDAAVVPMILLVSVMATGGTTGEVLLRLALVLAATAVLLGGFYILFNVIAPRLFLLPTYRRNRDLPILLAVVMATGSAWAAHAVGLSPALGALAAGILLAASPFAVQIRADTRPLMTVMVTLFFAALGLFGDPAWLVTRWKMVGAVVFVIVVGKPVVIAVLARVFGQPWRYGIAAGLCLAQVGEFSFVLATIAQSDLLGVALVSQETFRTMVTATIVTLLTTPYLVAASPRLGAAFERAFPRRWRTESKRDASAAASTDGADVSTGEPDDRSETDKSSSRGTILIIGFSAVGRQVAASLRAKVPQKLVAIDMDPARTEVAARDGMTVFLGDATQRDVLHHAGVGRPHVVVLTLRDYVTAHHMIHLIRDLFPDASIVARCRYHIHYFALVYAGAHEVVDEDSEIAVRLATSVSELAGTGG